MQNHTEKLDSLIDEEDISSFIQDEKSVNNSNNQNVTVNNGDSHNRVHVTVNNIIPNIDKPLLRAVVDREDERRTHDEHINFNDRRSYIRRESDLISQDVATTQSIRHLVMFTVLFELACISLLSVFI